MGSRFAEGFRLTLALVAVVALVVLVGCFSRCFSGGVDEQALRKAVRWTVGGGSIFFLAAFVASSVNSVFRAGWSKWLLRNRRWLGLSFAGVHYLHAACFLSLAFLYTASFWRTTALSTVIGGAIGYVWVIAMTITSFDGPTRAIGKRAWTALHKSGMYVLWGILVFSYVGKVGRSPAYAILVTALFAAVALRAFARARAFARTRGATASHGR